MSFTVNSTVNAQRIAMCIGQLCAEVHKRVICDDRERLFTNIIDTTNETREERAKKCAALSFARIQLQRFGALQSRNSSLLNSINSNDPGGKQMLRAICMTYAICKYKQYQMKFHFFQHEKKPWNRSDD